jgi:hypothetical protein
VCGNTKAASHRLYPSGESTNLVYLSGKFHGWADHEWLYVTQDAFAPSIKQIHFSYLQPAIEDWLVEEGGRAYKRREVYNHSTARMSTKQQGLSRKKKISTASSTKQRDCLEKKDLNCIIGSTPKCLISLLKSPLHLAPH